MAWTSPKTWSGSEVLTSADMNAQCSGNIDYLYDNFALSNQFINGTNNVAQANQRIESGIAWVAGTTTSYGSMVVTFNTAFGTAPRVICTTTDSYGEFATSASVGTGSFLLYSYRPTGTRTGTWKSHWIAIGA